LHSLSIIPVDLTSSDLAVERIGLCQVRRRKKTNKKGDDFVIK